MPWAGPLTTGEVQADPGPRRRRRRAASITYTFPIDATGDFKGTGIAPGSYLVVVFQEDKSIDFHRQRELRGRRRSSAELRHDSQGVRRQDDSRGEESPGGVQEEERRSDARRTQKIANLNTLLTQARADTKAGNFDAAITAMQQATTQKPDEGILWVALGDAQLGSADAAAKAAKAAGKPSRSGDPGEVSLMPPASYKKAVDANAASKKPSPETAAAAYNQLGQALAKSGDGKGASDAYEAGCQGAAR